MLNKMTVSDLPLMARVNGHFCEYYTMLFEHITENCKLFLKSFTFIYFCVTIVVFANMRMTHKDLNM